MDLRAYWGTAIIHATGLMLATMSLGATPPATNCCGAGGVGDGKGGSGASNRLATEPHLAIKLFLVSHQEPRRLFTIFTLRADTLDPDETMCPQNGATDRDAVLPRHIDAAGLGGLPLSGENPAVCVFIRRDGLVGEAYIARSSGDPSEDDSLLRIARSIRFGAAQRSGKAVDAWYRLIVSRPLGGNSESLPPAEPPAVPFYYAL